MSHIIYSNDLYIVKKRYINIILITIFTIFVSLAIPKIAQANIFDPGNNDKSVEYLSNIFGNHINKALPGEDSIEVNAFLAQIFQIFNTIVLSIAIIILAYVTTISTLNTAQEGQVMGKKWSSVWIPLRSAIGMLMLAPLPGSGYSSLQVIIMWIILNGVGAANYTWNFVLDNLSKGISITQKEQLNTESVNAIKSQSQDLAKSLFNAIACVKILNKVADNSEFYQSSYYDEHEPTTIPAIITDVNPTMSNKLIFGVHRIIGPMVTDISQGLQERSNICGELNIQASLNQNELLNHNDDPINITNEQKNELLQRIYDIKYKSIKLLIARIEGLVTSIIDNAEKKPNKEIILPNELNITSILYPAVKEYQQNISNITKQNLLQYIHINSPKDNQAISELIINQGKKFGWITAGSYYYLLSQTPINNLLNTAKEQKIVQEPLFANGKILNEEKLKKAVFKKPDSSAVTLQDIKPYVNALDQKHQYINNLFISPKQEELIIDDQLTHAIKKTTKQQRYNNIVYQKLPDEFKKIQDTYNENHAVIDKVKKIIIEKHPELRGYIDSFFNLYEIAIKEVKSCFNASHDPLVSQAILGNQLMQAAESFWVGITVGSLISKEFTGIPNIEEKHKSFLVGLMPVTLIFAGIIWTIGATMSIYTPMVPYIIFIITALSWYLLAVESIVAAPIVAIGFISPSQDELGKVAPALGIIANMFLKPTLMVIGLLASAKLYNVMVKMVNLGFQFSLSTLQTQSGSSIFSWIVIIILYCGFVVTLVNKCYALIYQLPDKILRWIGVTGEQTDVSTVKEIQQHVEQGTKQGMAPIEGAVSSAAKSLQENLKLAAAAKKGPGGTGGDPTGLI